MKLNWRNIVFVSCILLLVGIQVAVASPYQYISGIPVSVHFFLLVNLFQLSIAIAMMIEIKKTSPSSVWDNNNIANLLNILHTLALVVILDQLYSSTSHYILSIIGALYTFAVLMVVVTEYLLIKPLTSKKNILKIKYVLFCIFVSTSLWCIFIPLLSLELPQFKYPSFLVFFWFFYAFIIITFTYIAFMISRGYEKIGFVQKPFFAAGSGMVAIISALISITYLTRTEFATYFYYLVFYFIVSGFTSIYYLKFIVEYPSLLQPKWKSLMPFDLPKIAAAITLTFLAASVYFTTKEAPNSVIYQNIPYSLIAAFLLFLFIGILMIFTYLKTLTATTKLRYWKYLGYGLYIHLTVTFYVLSLISLSWNTMTSNSRLLGALFGVVTFFFYLFFALDLRAILADQKIQSVIGWLDVSRYLVTFFSFFFIVLFCISFAYDKLSLLKGIELTSYPALLFFIAFFLIAFGTYLSITHKGFEEILKKNIWSELSYLAAFAVFLLVYLLFTSTLTVNLERFPYHNLAFIGYFLVLIIEILSVKSLAQKFDNPKEKKEDIVHLLNLHAHNYLRTDYLEDLWDVALERYVAKNGVKKLGFDLAKRRFDLAKIDEKTRLAIAVSILLGMYQVPNVEKITVLKRSLDETKEEIVNNLEEKILLLPEDLRSAFDERAYYPILYEKAINELLSHFKTFISLNELRMIFDRLKRREELFSCVSFEVDEIRIKEGTKISRQDFLKLFRLYLEAIGEEFPFKRCLLHGLVKEEVNKELQTITVGDVLDIVPTGLKELDMVMEGGLVKGSTTLLIAEETKAKHRVLISFINQALKAGTFAIYATSKRPSQQILGELRMETERLENFEILDLYEPIHTEERVTEVAEAENRIIVPFSKLLFQRSLVKAIKSKPRDAPKIVIMDVYDEFSRYFNPKEILELLQQQVEGFKRWNCTSLITLDPYSYLTKKEGLEEVKKNFDNIIILSGGDKDTSVFIEKLYHGTPFGHISHLPW